MNVIFVSAEDESPAICYLSAYLKKYGHKVSLIFEPKQFARAYMRNDSLARFFSREKDNLRKIGKLNPELICFSCTTAHYQWALSFANKIKKYYFL